MGESRSTHLGKVCDTCGNVGYEELIRICSQCTIRRHLYCMMVLVMDVPDDWVCEVCLPKNEIDSLKSGQTEDVQDSSRKVCFNLGRQVACKRQKAVETGKVKFLPTEEVIKLSSGLPKMPFPLMRNFRSKPAPENFTPSPSRRTFVGSTTVGPYFNPNKEKRNPSFLQLGSANPPRRGVVQISSSISQHAGKTSKKLKEDEETAPQTLAKKYSTNEEPASSVMAAKEVKTVNSKAMNSMRETCSASATSKLCLSIVNKEGAIVVPTKENVCKGQTLDAIPPDKENRILHTKTDETTRPSRPSASRLSTTIVGSGRNFHDASESEHSDVAETETWNRLKISLYRPHLPALYPIWTGGFKFLDTATPGEFYGGFLAQPPCKVHCKAYEFSQKMPPVLQVNLLLQCHLQADLFQNGCLDLCDIALYIFPVNYIERSQKNYNELFQLMEMKSSVMISYIDGVELLIFTSKQLHVGSRDIFTKSNTDFFCGVFRHAKQNRSKVHQKLPPLVSPLEYTHDDNANMESSKAFDMDIDMVGGKIIGIPDMVVSKESTWEFNEQVARETLDPITDRKFSTVSGDLSFVIQPISLEFKQECHNDCDLRSKSTEKIKSKFILKRVEHPLESSLGRSTGRIGEIDILPGFEVISKQNSRDRAPKAPIAEEKNDLDKRGTMNQVKEEIGCQGTLQVAFGVSRPQRQEYIDDASLRGSQKQHQILKTSDHLVNGPSAACPPPPPRLFGEGNEVESVIKIDGNENEKPFERREKKGLQRSPFLSKDKSQTISGSLCRPFLVEVKAEVQEVVNDPSAACPSRLLNKGTKIGLQTKIQEHDREKPDETRDKKGVQGSLFVSKDKSKMIAGCVNDPCAAGVKAEMHTTLPSNMETSICSGPFASTRVKLSVAGRSRGNAGAASVGGLIRDEAGKWIVGYNLNLGIYDCLQTNLWALFLGIKFTWDRGYRKVLVESDSITAVEFLKKAPSQPNSNRVLIERCIELLSRKWDCKVYSLQREKNLCANWLATHVEGCSLGMSIINVPPSELIPLLEDDCIQVARALDSPLQNALAHVNPTELLNSRN